jgi:hypothetical protein
MRYPTAPHRQVDVTSHLSLSPTHSLWVCIFLSLSLSLFFFVLFLFFSFLSISLSFLSVRRGISLPRLTSEKHAARTVQYGAVQPDNVALR